MNLICEPEEKITVTGLFPDTELALYIAGFWEIEAENIKPGRYLIIPDGRMGAIIDISGSSNWIINEMPCRGSVVIGQQSTTAMLEIISNSFRAFGFTFHPWGAAPFFDCSLEKIKNNVIPVSSLFTPEQEREIREKADFSERVQSFICFLSEMLKLHNLDPRLADSVKKLRNNFYLPLSEITSEAGIGLRSLEKLAKKQFGISLTRFRKILRMRKAFWAIRESPTRSLADIAVEMGYSDQAHMNRDFSELAGITPAAILKMNRFGLVMSGFLTPETAELMILEGNKLQINVNLPGNRQKRD